MCVWTYPLNKSVSACCNCVRDASAHVTLPVRREWKRDTTPLTVSQSITADSRATERERDRERGTQRESEKEEGSNKREDASEGNEKKEREVRR